jgi:hypothetical protein
MRGILPTPHVESHILLPPQVIRKFHRYQRREGEVVPEAKAETDGGADSEGEYRGGVRREKVDGERQEGGDINALWPGRCPMRVAGWALY